MRYSANRLIRSVEGAGVLHLRYEVQSSAERSAAAAVVVLQQAD